VKKVFYITRNLEKCHLLYSCTGKLCIDISINAGRNSFLKQTFKALKKVKTQFGRMYTLFWKIKCMFTEVLSSYKLNVLNLPHRSQLDISALVCIEWFLNLKINTFEILFSIFT